MTSLILHYVFVFFIIFGKNIPLSIKNDKIKHLLKKNSTKSAEEKVLWNITGEKSLKLLHGFDENDIAFVANGTGSTFSPKFLVKLA